MQDVAASVDRVHLFANHLHLDLVPGPSLYHLLLVMNVADVTAESWMEDEIGFVVEHVLQDTIGPAKMSGPNLWHQLLRMQVAAHCAAGVADHWACDEIEPLGLALGPNLLLAVLHAMQAILDSVAVRSAEEVEEYEMKHEIEVVVKRTVDDMTDLLATQASLNAVMIDLMEEGVPEREIACSSVREMDAYAK
eukprot:gnl/TRDRNA2_/TRDRNA2_167035_c1_seq1.p2 gnl/TRDRNA2_/TRDRNA2_167035_c1~~gnl/TRDRNA2_/TRDRNA2_167035_c1_seq1.p2  ORF type:complete len:193 (+),score=43.97 gnl/TRDRNA2_/TRDRNA2_167035_c1_seq1:932-1510(+)